MDIIILSKQKLFIIKDGYINSNYRNYEEDTTVFCKCNYRTFMVILIKVIRAALQTLCFIHTSK